MTELTQVFLMVQDRDRSRRFYEECLGLTPERIGDESVSYRTGSVELKLQPDFDPEVLAEFGLESPGEPPRGKGQVTVLEFSESLEERADRIAEHLRPPACVVQEPREVPWPPGRMMLVRDPDGYLYECRGNIERS